jgi:hypothetical protein
LIVIIERLKGVGYVIRVFSQYVIDQFLISIDLVDYLKFWLLRIEVWVSIVLVLICGLVLITFITFSLVRITRIQAISFKLAIYVAILTLELDYRGTFVTDLQLLTWSKLLLLSASSLSVSCSELSTQVNALKQQSPLLWLRCINHRPWHVQYDLFTKWTPLKVIALFTDTLT